MATSQREVPLDEELELGRKAKDGDQQAITALTELFRPRLRAKAAKELLAFSNIDPDDVVQDVLLRALTRIEVFDPQYPWSHWAFGILDKRIKQLIGKKSKLRRESATDFADGHDGSEAGAVRTPSEEQIPAEHRALSGGGRFAPPDALVERHHIFLELLEGLLNWGGYPHQQAAFTHSVVFWGRPNPKASKGKTRAKVPITGDPDRVVRELGSEKLSTALRGFQEHLIASRRVRPDDMRTLFRAVDYRLRLVGETLFKRDKRSAQVYARVLDRLVGETALADYFASDPRKSVAEWTDAVKERVQKYMAGELDLTRSPLPWPDGPENSSS